MGRVSSSRNYSIIETQTKETGTSRRGSGVNGEQWIVEPTHSASRLLLRITSSWALINTLLQRQKLLRPERLIVNLGSRLNEILQVGSGQEVSQVHEFAVVRVFDVDDSPTGLAATDGLAVDDDIVLRPYNGEWDYLLYNRINIRHQRNG